MIDFDDLTIEQKANLADEEVRTYIRIYAMEQGVPLATNDVEDYAEEPHVQLDETEFFTVEHEEPTNSLGIVFTTPEDAEAFCRLSYRFVSEKYLAGYHRTQKFTIAPSGRRVVSRRLPTDVEVERNLAALEEQAAISKANAELRNQRNNRERKISRLSEYIWGFVREARARLNELEDIRSCWAEYQELAKDQSSAIKFMLKAYGDNTEKIAEALGDNWNEVPAEALPIMGSPTTSTAGEQG